MTKPLAQPVPVGRFGQLSRLDQLAAIPEEDIWLAKQKSKQTRRAYWLDVWHFMRALGITTTAALRQVDHRAVIAWERMQREREGAAPSTVRRRLAASRHERPRPDLAGKPASPGWNTDAGS